MTTLPDFAVFEDKADLRFKDKDLLVQAFLHRSFLNEHREIRLEHNERLEFLGDAVLELVITDYLYRTFPDKTEGDLTAYRAALVNANTLAQAAAALDMNDFLLLSRGETKDTGRARNYILANTFEALIGAVYLDQGYAATRDFIARQLFTKTEDIVAKHLWQDAKSLFQERAQEKMSITPVYRLLNEVGPDHNKRFTVGLFLGDELVISGDGHSKQEAEQDAARKGLLKQGWEN